MTPEQVSIVKETWQELAPSSELVAQIFYDRLFELDPTYRTMFNADIGPQGRKLTQMLGQVVGNLDQIERILPAVEALGRRHVLYGVGPRDYDVVGDALIWTLERGLAEKFTEECREAWQLAYATLASVMIQAAETADDGCRQAGPG